MNFETFRLASLLTMRCNPYHKNINEVIEGINNDLYCNKRHTRYILNHYETLGSSNISDEDKEQIKQNQEENKEYEKLIELAELIKTLNYELPIIDMEQSIGIIKFLDLVSILNSNKNKIHNISEG